MIELRIMAENPSDFAKHMTALAAVFAGNASTSAPLSSEPTEAPKSGRGRKSAAPTAGASETASTGQTADGSAGAAETAGSNEPITKEALASKCSAYGAKAGPEALKQLFIEQGAPNGKWSEVPADKYEMLNARLDEMMGG